MVRPGDNAVFLCNATTAGNSSAAFEWVMVTPLPEAAVESNNRITVSTFTSDVVDEVCKGIAGVYQLPLQSVLGRDLDVEMDGATLLLHYSALVICNANSSLTNNYTCFATNTSSPVEVVLLLSVSSDKVPAGIIAGVVVTVAVLVLIYCVFVAALNISKPKYFSLRNAPMLMTSRGRATSSRDSMNATNPFLEESNSQQEFSRDRLCLLGILGRLVQCSLIQQKTRVYIM